jgi:hypothetical protein
MYNIIYFYSDFWRIIFSNIYFLLIHIILSLLLFFWLIKYRNTARRRLYGLISIFFVVFDSFYFGILVYLIYFAIGDIFSTLGTPDNYSGGILILFVGLYIASFFLLYYNRRYLMKVQSNIIFALRYIFYIFTIFVLLTPTLYFIFSISGPSIDGDYGLPQVCLSAGESVGCKMYNNNGITDDVVQWCEEVYQASQGKDPNGKSLYENWEQNKNYLEEISIKAYARQADTEKILKIPSTPDSITKGTADAIYPCINPSKGGYVYIVGN